MGRIKLLPDALISQIAAGEVVERPASVVKELIENSIDAGATHCIIEIEQGGMKLIRVVDNGCGMSPEDARMAFLRHATSKIFSLEELLDIHTFGFRGEALASVASVAQVSLRTREKESESGCELKSTGAVLGEAAAVGCPAGTEIIVRNLFFNVPARRKFLKSETTELHHIVDVVLHAALAHPGVAFDLKSNGKTLMQCVQTSDPARRTADVLGNAFSRESCPLEFNTSSIHIHGRVGKPGMELRSRRQQFLFVNGRAVSDALVARAVSDAYGSRLPGRTYPVFILNVDLDSRDVDVNVHPRKLSVKFVDPQRIYRDLFQAVSQALDKSQSTIAHPPILPESSPGAAVFFADRDSSQAPFDFSIVQEKRAEDLSQNVPIAGYFAQGYIAVAENEGLALFDQHAAHERILYEKFCARCRNSDSRTIQKLIAPLVFECSTEQARVLRDAHEFFEAIGFEFEEWSGDSFAFHGIPADIKTDHLERILRQCIDDILNEKTPKNLLHDKMLKSLACRSAVMFGMSLSEPEQKKLLEDLGKTPNNATCPHGRPTKIVLTFEEIERRFYRRK